jgi:hypothetical protein
MRKIAKDEKKGRGLKILGTLFLAGGLFGAQAKASIPTTTPSIKERVAAVRVELHKHLNDAKVASKLPWAEREVASWLNWVNWPNWNNWRNWNNWANWQNWLNF